MSNPLLLTTTITTRRKRSRSSAETLNLTLPYDTKRARIGIQELTTNPLPASSIIRPDLRLSSRSEGSGPESGSLEEGDYTSSGIDSSSSSEETTSSSSDEESSAGHGIDEGYDSDSESGSTTTSSSSSSSGDEGEQDSDENNEKNRSSRSATVALKFSGRSRDKLTPPSSSVSLAAKLNAFLPRMAAANAELESVKERGLLQERNIEQVDEGERYIEMDLGLGVLEEKQDGASSGSENDGDESEAGSTRSKSSIRSGRKDTMAVLMGKKCAKRPDIQVVEV